MASTINPNEHYTILGSTLQDICNAVKDKTGASEIEVTDLADEIENIEIGGGGGGGSLKTFTVTFVNAGDRSGDRKFFYESGMTWRQYEASEYCPIVKMDDMYTLFSDISEGIEEPDYLCYMGGMGDSYFVTDSNGFIELDTLISDTITYEVDYEYA